MITEKKKTKKAGKGSEKKPFWLKFKKGKNKKTEDVKESSMNKFIQLLVANDYKKAEGELKAVVNQKIKQKIINNNSNLF